MTLRPSFGIFPKLLLTMLVVTLTPLGAIWYLDYRAESESLSRQIEQRLGSQADAIVGYVSADLLQSTGQPSSSTVFDLNLPIPYARPTQRQSSSWSRLVTA